MMKTKHFLLCCVAVLCSISTFAHDFEVNGIYYNFLSGDSVAVTYQGDYCWNTSIKYSGTITITATVEYNSTTYRVTSIGSSAFYRCSSLTAITIPNSVTSIGSSAFDGCSSLTSITIPNGVTSIGNYTFSDCSALADITCLAITPPKISYSTFDEISSSAKVYVMYESINTYKNAQYWNSQNIQALKFETNGIYYQHIGGDSIEVTYKGDDYDSYTNEYSGTVIIPDTLEYNNITFRVTAIGNNTFRNCPNLNSITIPNGVSAVGVDAFLGCSNLQYNTYDNALYLGNIDNPYLALICAKDTSITSCTIHENTRAIAGRTFANCTKLTSVTIPNGVISINEGVFENCSALEKVNYLGTTDSWCNINFSINGSNPLHCGADFYLNDVKVIDWIIPQEKEYVDDWFSGCTSIQSVTIPNSVSNFSSSAFSGCSSLSSIVWNIKYLKDFYNPSLAPFYEISSQITAFTFGDEVWRIPSYLCDDMSNLTEITIPSSVGSIGEGAFSGCSNLTDVTWNARSCSDYKGYYNSSPFNYSLSTITSFTFGDEVIYIPAYLCKGMSKLTSITIPHSVSKIGEGVFDDDCSGITNITWNAKNCTSAPFGNIASQVTSFTFGDKVEYIPQGLCSGMTQLTNITISDSVTTIGYQAFYECSNLTSITIGSSVATIHRCAFQGCYRLSDVRWNAKRCQDFTANSTPFCEYNTQKEWYTFDFRNNITSFTLGNEVEHIPSYLFAGMDRLYNIVIPDKVTTIGEHAFYSCSNLTEVTLGNSVDTIGSSAFEDCSKLTEVIIPNSVTTIGSSAFEHCSKLTTVAIGDSVTTIGDAAFSNCSNLTDVSIGNSVISIGKKTFKHCSSLIDIIIPNSVTTIGDYAFYRCDDLTKITIGNGVTSIGESAFEDCDNLTEIIIGESVTTFGKYALNSCDKLSSVIWNVKNYQDFNFSDTPFYYDVWGMQSYDLRPQITSFTFGNSVQHIPAYLCDGMRNLTEITIPNSVTSIGNSAFSDCSGLTDNIILPNSVVTIGGYAFSGTRLSSITLGNKVTTIGMAAFQSCQNLTEITLPSSITTIGHDAFYLCDSLTQTNYTGDVASWCKIQFDGIQSNPITNSNNLYINGQPVIKLVIPKDVTCISEYSFVGLKSLTEVIIPNSVTEIGSYAFWGCSNITKITSEAVTPPIVGPYDTFYGVDYSIPLYVPAESIETYKSAWYWEEFTNILGIGQVTNITLDQQEMTLVPQQFVQLIATITPEDALNKNILWTSDNEEVAIVENGLVTALAKGEAIITATTEDGGATATCKVIVKDDTALKNVSIDTNSSTRKVLENGTIYILKPNGEKYTIDGQRVE